MQRVILILLFFECCYLGGVTDRKVYIGWMFGLVMENKIYNLGKVRNDVRGLGGLL